MNKISFSLVGYLCIIRAGGLRTTKYYPADPQPFLLMGYLAEELATIVAKEMSPQKVQQTSSAAGNTRRIPKGYPH